MKQNFNKSGEFSVYLTKADLIDIQSLLVADSNDYEVRISCTIANLSLNAESFNEFNDNEGVPEQFDYLSIKASRYTENMEQEKWVAIKSYSKSNTLSIHLYGTNETWVLGFFNILANTFSLLEQQRKIPSDTTASISKSEYQQKGYIQASVLTKDDTIDLINILQSNASNAEDLSHVSIYSELPGIKIEANNIYQFFEQNKLPKKLDNFTAFASGKDNAFAYISIGVLSSFITVKGNNEIWVRGKYSQLMDFLKKRRLWYWFIQKPFAFIAIMLLTISVSALVSSIIERQFFGLFLSSISTISWMLAIVFHSRGKLLPIAYIDLRTKQLKISKEDISLIVAIITFGLYIFELFAK